MCTPLFCGTFHHQEELELEECMEPWSPSRKNNGISSKSSSKDSKNPYSNLGLDKFSALLADLNEKRQKIFTEKGSEDISFLWFVYSNSNRCRPFVVKLKEKRNKQLEKPSGKQRDSGVSAPKSDRDARKKILSRGISMKMDNMKRSLCYLPVIIALLLLSIAVFGRSFAVMCTSVGWYLVPDIVGSETSKPNKKKD